MGKRRAWWLGVVLFLAALVSLGIWRLLREVPELVRKAETAIAEESAKFGLRVTYGEVRFHLLALRVSLDNLAVEDAEAGLPLARARQVDLSISPRRILTGYSPVSRIRAQGVSLRFEERNRPLLERLRKAGSGGGSDEPVPEILLTDGTLVAGPIGSLVRWETQIRQVRIRELRFLGTQASGAFERSSASIRLPGEGEERIPFDSAEADLTYRKGTLRVRSFRAAGPSASLRISGLVDTRESSASLKASGRADIAGWIAEGAVGKRLLARIATRGRVDLSAEWKGGLADPVASGKLLLADGLFPGNTPAEGELAVAVSGGRVRVKSLRGRIWEGTLSGTGEFDRKTGEGQGTVSLERAMFGKVPWSDWGIPWAPAGTGTVQIGFSGTRERVRLAVSLASPGGLERRGARTVRVPLPVSATLSGEVAPGREILAREYRVVAGKAEIQGKGSYRIPDGGVFLSARISVPQGSVAQYGWEYPIAWQRLKGNGEVSGTRDRLLVKGGFTAEGLAARSLPPVPLSVKFDGDPGKAIHFVADIPADLGKMTATGTFTGPLSADPLLLNASMIAREIDFSRIPRWAGAFLASLGDSRSLSERSFPELSGTGSADLQCSIGTEEVSVSGTLESPALRVSGISARSVSLMGGWSRKGSGTGWRGRASGEIGEGTFLVTGQGDPEAAGISGRADRIDLGWVLSHVGRNLGERVGGLAGITFSARSGRSEWEVDRLAVSVPRLEVRVPDAGAEGGVSPVVWEEVAGEGSLGERSGSFRIASASPRMEIRGEVERQPAWPATVSFEAEEVPTAFFLGLAGRKRSASGGVWSARGKGSARIPELFGKTGFRIESVRELEFAVSARSPSVEGISFEELRATGKKEGEALAGTIETRLPDTRLAANLSLREPFAFRLEGPFSAERAGEPGPLGENGKGVENGKERARFSLDGRVEASGSVRAPGSTTGTLAVRRLSYQAGGFTLTGEGITLRLAPGEIRWAGGSLAASGNPVRVSGHAAWDGSLDFRLEGKLPAAMARLATDVFERLDGTVHANLRVTGRWDDPTLVGTGRLEGGTLSFRGYAQLFEEMNADLVLSRERIVIEDFEGRSGGGYLDGRGEVPLRFDERQRLYFTVDFFDMRYPYPEEIRPLLQGHLELLGPPDDLLITGEVEVQSARYTKTIHPEKALLDFRRRLADVTARRVESDFRIRLDIDAVADGTIRVKNNLADILAKGEFKVAGDTSRVIILGSFDGIEGTVEYRSNRYQLGRLNVDFQDPLRNNPRIDGRAETKVGSVTVSVSVTGTLEDYEVDFASDPPLSKNDIISLLSLGVTAESLAEAAGSVSAAEAASIALGPYKGRVEEEIRGIVGLDRFSIEPAFSSTDKSFEPRFTVGKSFGERFSVSVSTSVGASAESSATAELKVLENMFLQGVWKSATPDREGDLGGDVRFRYRYRQFRDIFDGRD